MEEIRYKTAIEIKEIHIKKEIKYVCTQKKSQRNSIVIKEIQT